MPGRGDSVRLCTDATNSLLHTQRSLFIEDKPVSAGGP
jgi:hypothetical protein